MAPRPALDRRLSRLASALDPAWLEAQRWYRAKSQRIAKVELVDAAPIDRHAWLLVLGATNVSGGVSRYLVPAIVDDDAFREPRDGEGVWRAIASLIVAGGELDAARGSWVFAPTPTLGELLPGGAGELARVGERRLGVQQSNTSVAFADRLMLKVYRLLEPGANPEVEVSVFLTTVEFAQAPAVAGSATYLLDGEPHSAALLQQFIPSAGDAWSWLLGRLIGSPDVRAEALAGVEQIGDLTARMHAALASRPTTPGFPSRVATSGELADWRSAAGGQLDGALAALHGAPRMRLAAIAPLIDGGLDSITSAREVRVSRIHGDYHLGQLLRTEAGFMVIDFEGEPARTPAERGAPASRLRDVAGMLRSLDYAAHSAIEAGASPDGMPGWLLEARAAFLDGYGGIDPDDRSLLAAFELEKACYEVHYEADNRPDWVWLPLEALERLALAG